MILVVSSVEVFFYGFGLVLYYYNRNSNNKFWVFLDYWLKVGLVLKLEKIMT